MDLILGNGAVQILCGEVEGSCTLAHHGVGNGLYKAVGCAIGNLGSIDTGLCVFAVDVECPVGIFGRPVCGNAIDGGDHQTPFALVACDQAFRNQSFTNGFSFGGIFEGGFGAVKIGNNDSKGSTDRIRCCGGGLYGRFGRGCGIRLIGAAAGNQGQSHHQSK